MCAAMHHHPAWHTACVQMDLRETLSGGIKSGAPAQGTGWEHQLRAFRTNSLHAIRWESHHETVSESDQETAKLLSRLKFANLEFPLDLAVVAQISCNVRQNLPIGWVFR